MKFQKGLSLIELMVAMTLSLIMMLGVTQIFISNKQSFDITHDLGFMQESGRIALSLISDSVRNADHWAGIDNSSVDYGTTTLSSIPSGCSVSDVFDKTFPVQGFEGAAIVPAAAKCIVSGDYVPNTDILALRYADGRYLYSEADLALDANKNNYFVRTQTGQSAYIFKGSNNVAATAQIPLVDSVYNMKYATDIYFIRPCSLQVKVASSFVCKDETPIPTLVRLSLIGDEFVQEALIEGIEQLQFEYGVDTDNDFNVDEYQTATQVTNSAASWENVISVRLNLIARSNVPDFSIDKTKEQKYTLVGDTDYSVPDGDKIYRRKLYQREIYIRNRGLL